VLLLDSVTTVPPVGAAPDRVTVPVELVPPATVVGFSVSAVSVGAADAGVRSPRKVYWCPSPLPLSDAHIRVPLKLPLEKLTAASGASTLPFIPIPLKVIVVVDGKLNRTYCSVVPCTFIAKFCMEALEPVTLIRAVAPAGTLIVTPFALASVEAATEKTLSPDFVPANVTAPKETVVVPVAA